LAINVGTAIELTVVKHLMAFARMVAAKAASLLSAKYNAGQCALPSGIPLCNQ
jgi:hypothetical protein